MQQVFIETLISATCVAESANATNKIPWSLVGQIWQYLDNNGKKLIQNFANTKKMRLTAYPLIVEIADSINRGSQSGNDSIRLHIYSGQEAVITSLAVALGFHNGRTPPFASRIVLEVMKNMNDKTRYMRVLYNGRDVTSRLRFCTSVDKAHNGLCEASKFLSFAFETNLMDYSARTYQEACKSKRRP